MLDGLRRSLASHYGTRIAAVGNIAVAVPYNYSDEFAEVRMEKP
jgi:hypothetical protein